MEESITWLEGAIEAILFSMGEAIPLKELSKALDDKKFFESKLNNQGFISKYHGFGARSRTGGKGNKSFAVGREGVFGDSAFVFFGGFGDGLFAEPETV